MTRNPVLLATRNALSGLAMAAGLAACATPDQTAVPVQATAAAPVMAAASAAEHCERLAGSPVEAGAVEAAGWIAGNTTLAGGRMEGAETTATFCRARVRLNPVAGSDIHVEVWLPETWNNKLMGFGGGGFDGGLGPGAAPLFNNAMERGYAVVATDAGHKQGASIESWVHQQPEKVVDFGHRANHLAAVAARQIISIHYGAQARHAYFFGCSGGGREALMLAMRYPADYDGIIAGAPARRYPEILTQLHWYTQAVSGPGGAPNLESKLDLVRDAVHERCDALDGVDDGILENPLLCSFDPGVLRCEGADAPTCLTGPEIEALRKIYDGPRLRDGSLVISGPEVGNEGSKEWTGWVTSNQGSVYAQEFYRWFVYDDPDWSIENFDLDRDYAAAREHVAPILNVEDPDLSAFTGHGGKLIMYQGWDDPGIPPSETIEYYEAVQRQLGPEAGSQVRLFMVPSMGHCLGGPGATSFDMQPVLERWIEHGEAPERVIAVKPDSGEPPLTHPLCVWPKTAHYNGTGSTRDAANYSCQ